MKRFETCSGVVLLTCCGATAAQDGQSMANLVSDSRRFAECFNELQADCVFALTHVESMAAAGIRSPYMDREALRQLWAAPQDPVSTRVASGMAIFGQTPDERMTSFEALQPQEPFPGLGKLYAFVPFRQTNTSVRGRLEREAFFVGISEDAGESWRFVIINGLHIQPAGVARIYPELAGRELPPISNEIIPWPEPASSEYLRTTEGTFAIVEGAATYELRFEVRKRLDSDILLVMSFDDPADAAEPVTMEATLEAGDETFEVDSPALSGFEAGEHYDIEIVGLDPATDEELFVHRQTLLFDPTYEMKQLLGSVGGGAPN